MKNYQGILFDFDGTLADSQPAILVGLKKTFEHFDREPPPNPQLRSVIGLGLAQGFQALLPGETFAVEEWVEVYRDIYLQVDHQTQLYPQVQTLLDSIYNLGIPMGVVSNKNARVLELAMERLGIREFMDVVVGESVGQPLKPDPAVFHTLIRPIFWDVPPEEVLLVGDTPIDILFAHNVGMDACWVKYGYGDPETSVALNPRFTVSDPNGVKDLIVVEGNS